MSQISLDIGRTEAAVLLIAIAGLAAWVLLWPQLSTFVSSVSADVGGETYSMNELRTQATNLTEIGRENILKNHKSYEGDVVYVTGKITQVIDADYGYDFLVATEYQLRTRFQPGGYRGGSVWMYYDAEDGDLNMTADRPIKGQILETWTIYEGPYTYETVSGAPNTVPLFKILHANIEG